MPDDAVPAFRFNRPLGFALGTPIPPRSTNRSERRSNPAKPSADPAEANGTPVQAKDQGAVEADAERFLRCVKGDLSQPVGSADWLRRAGLNIRRASDAQHLEAIALAYATHVRISASPLRPTIIAELEALSGRKRSRTTLDLHLIVERFVSYGGETPAERLAARKLVSRDVRAIQHLEAAKILPSRVQALAATPGQGLHAWARQNTVAKRATISLSDAIGAERQAKAEARQRALTHEVVITTRRPDGTRKARQRYPITGVLLREIDTLRRRVRSLAKRIGSEG